MSVNNNYSQPVNPGYPPRYPYAPQPQPKKSNGCLIAGLIGGGVLILGFIIFAVIIFSALASVGKNASSTDAPSYTGHDGYVAVLHIEGTIASTAETGLFSAADGYDQQYLMNSVMNLANDPDNKGLLLYIDSPGGEVYATDELYLRIIDYKERTGRPVYTYCASMAASGGYYLAAAADQILMNRNCMTGSIGVTAGTTIDISEFLEKNGIKTTSIYVGKNKTMGSNFEEFTEEQKEIYVSILKETYDQFVAIVAEGRDMEISEVETLADGRIYSPKQALENGLIDGIMGYDEAVHQFISDNNWSEDTQVLNFQPITDVSLSDLFMMIGGNRKTELETYLSYVDNPIDGIAYYYEGLG